MKKMSLRFSPMQTARSLLVLLIIACAAGGNAQQGNPPSANCHVSDGQFTACPGGGTEWSDVQPIPFPASNAFLYVNQDPNRQFIWLLYDFPFKTTPLAATDAVRVSFDTVEQPQIAFVHYDVDLFGDGSIQVNEFGQPEAPGRIAGTTGFGVSPNSSVPHVIVELQVPLTPGEPTSYSPDPIFWGAAPPGPPPPPPCPTDAGKSFNNCQKKAAGQMGLIFGDTGLVLGAGLLLCGLATGGICVTGYITVAVALQALAFGLAANHANAINADPSDPNFTVIAQPVVVQLVPPIPPDAATPQQVVDAFNALFNNESQYLAFAQAAETATNRAAGARDAGNAFWVQQQTQAAQLFLAEAAPFLSTQSQLLGNLTTALQAAGVQSTFTANDVRNYQASLAANGLPSTMVQELNQLGVDSTGQALILQTLLSFDPTAASQLGVGRFPQAMTDPTVLNAIDAMAKTFTQAAPTVGNLVPFISTTLSGDYVASGVGLRGQTGGTINISGIPSGATIQNAYLYWGMLDDGEDASLANMSINGNPILGTRIGHGPDTCWGRTDSFSYRADVTPLVTGNGSYAVSNVANGGFILAEGAALLVIYDTGGNAFRTVMLSDGNVVLPAVFTGQSVFSGFTATSPVSAKTTFMVGDGQGFGNPAIFAGSAGSVTFSNPFIGSEGLYWDTLTFDVSPQVGAGNGAADAQIQLSGDCLLWPAQAFSVGSSRPAPLPATAAVVKATTDAHTSIDSRGLALSDIPPIVDRIAAIVQSRFIENPSIDPGALATQLVNSIPSAFLPPEGASAAISEVLNQVVTPTPRSGNNTPPTISCGSPDTQWHANDVSIACTATDNSGTGLNASSPSSFNLTTSVPAGTETATAFTGTRLICDNAGNCVTAGPIGPIKVDKKPPQITITAPAGSYLLKQASAANYACGDGGSGIATCAGPVASGSNFDTTSVGVKTFTVNATDAVGNASSQSSNYNVGFNVCLLYDATHAAKSGSTIPVKFQLCDANGNDASSASVVVTAVRVVMTSTNASFIVDDSGNANPDSNFRFDSTLGPTGGYIFNLQTTGLVTGTYVLTFSVAGDPTTHNTELVFQVR